MSGDSSHLTPAAARILAESNSNRIRAVQSERWVHYPRAGPALQLLNHLLDHPRTTRMPSIAIYADSGMGKTMIMEKFRRDHPAEFDADAGVERTRVLALQMAGKPGERRLYAQILAALGAPHWVRRTVRDQPLLISNRLRYGSCAPWMSMCCCSTRSTISWPVRSENSVLSSIHFGI